MKLRSLGRLGIVVTALVCLCAVFSASAMGAGKPSVSFFGEGASYGPNHQEFSAQVNPNGAATTVKFEYKKYTDTEWLVAASKEIGSGSEVVKSTTEIFPVLMHTKYQARATATNSYGSATSGIESFGVKWRIFGGGPGTHTSPYIAPGTFKVEWEPYAGISGKLECSQSGYGEFGPEAVSESLKLTLTGCSYYRNASLYCKPSKEIIVKLDNLFQAVGGGVTVKLCPEDEYLTPITFSEAFLVNSGHEGEYLVSRPTTMTAKGKVLGASATITSSSNLQLAGVNSGKMFAMVEAN